MTFIRNESNPGKSVNLSETLSVFTENHPTPSILFSHATNRNDGNDFTIWTFGCANKRNEAFKNILAITNSVEV